MHGALQVETGNQVDNVSFFFLYGAAFEVAIEIGKNSVPLRHGHWQQARSSAVLYLRKRSISIRLHIFCFEQKGGSESRSGSKSLSLGVSDRKHHRSCSVTSTPLQRCRFDWGILGLQFPGSPGPRVFWRNSGSCRPEEPISAHVPRAWQGVVATGRRKKLGGGEKRRSRAKSRSLARRFFPLPSSASPFL